MTTQISLSRGRFALIDDADLALVEAFGPWHAHNSAANTYARHNQRVDGRWQSIFMHRLLTDWSMVDHINGDGLDNRRSNLRPATREQNARNRRMRRDNTLGVKGVSVNGSGYRAVIEVSGQRINLGTYRTIEEAGRAYDAGALEHHGSFARINSGRVA